MQIKVLNRYVYFYLALVAANGETLMHSEVYFSKSNAMRAATKLAKSLRLKVSVED